MATNNINEAPRCPKCKFVMCEQFDTQRVNDHADLATPNGTYICYTCTPPKPTSSVRLNIESIVVRLSSEWRS